ncbi:hypothetical protein L596_024618 [Steinernema carpocapsae]|uniref:Uncharacterized protein n=1 Tax=Steinernema carpocapsae TaxID=34508 RepID=A0A4U5M591_STECR|nr:hypothetical protein L596_024618 [Steinernema carpocapsae]
MPAKKPACVFQTQPFYINFQTASSTSKAQIGLRIPPSSNAALFFAEPSVLLSASLQNPPEFHRIVPNENSANGPKKRLFRFFEVSWSLKTVIGRSCSQRENPLFL